MDVDRHGHRLVMHQPDAVEPEHVGDLVRVDEHGRRAVRDHGAGEFGHRHHAALDMHVPVAETGDEIAAAGVDHLVSRARSRVAASGPTIGKPPGGDGQSVPGMISPEWTLTQRPLRTTRSAGFRPAATSTRRGAVSAQLATPGDADLAMPFLS